MNKAFVREPEEPADARCPSCGVVGQPVGPATLAAHLPEGALREISSDAWFCASARCDVGYFDAFGQSVPAARLLRPAWPKDPAAPICACFGVSADEVIADARAGEVKRVRELIAKSSTSDAQCATRAANGQSCVGDVQRLFLKEMKR